MFFKINKVYPNFIAQYVDDDNIWVSRDNSIFKSRLGEDNFHKVIDLPVSFPERVLEKSRLFSRTFRLGIKSMLKLESGTILINSQKKVFRLSDNKLAEVFHFENGNGPLRQGWCEDNYGNCYVGEYFLNNNRNKMVKLFRSCDDGVTWQVIKKFNNIRHIHCVQYDPFTKTIWLGTGDHDYENGIYFSNDCGKSFQKIGSGSELFRTVSLIFTNDKVYWGTDSPTNDNFICSYNRKTGDVKKICPVDGPVHYSAHIKNFKFLGTVVEGNSEGNTLQWDKKAHIWGSKNSNKWEDIASWEKDYLPYIMGFGRILFPLGKISSNYLFFTTQALRDVDNFLMKAIVK